MGNHFFILEDEIHKDGGFNNPPRPTILKILKRHTLTIALDVEDAKKKYDPAAGYTHLLLDHDFEGWPNPDMSHPNCGLAFVQWLVKLKLPTPCPEVFLHSQNSKGRAAAHKLLTASGYKKVSHTPYGPEFIAMLSERFL